MLRTFGETLDIVVKPMAAKIGMSFSRSQSQATTSTKSVISGFSIKYNSFGDPAKVLRGENFHLNVQDVKETDVLVRMIAAPINPADINMIQGVYPVKPGAMPAVGGNEGLGEVIEVGKEVRGLEAGDWVLPALSGWGTWRSHAICDQNELMPIPRGIGLSPIAAATLAVNPCTAYRMLRDFEQLKPGDVVIQNGANSGCGQAVIQIADEMDVQTINIIRDRPNLHELVDTLKNLGATHVFTDEALRKPEVKDLLHSMKKPKLALNCVGGKNAAELVKFLQPGGTMVTYGGMSKLPLTVPAGPLIFKDIKLKGFWMTRWNTTNKDSPDRKRMIQSLCTMIKHGNLREPLSSLTHISDFQDAIEAAVKPFISEKQILVMEESLLDIDRD